MEKTSKQRNSQIEQIRTIISEKLIAERNHSQENDGLKVESDWSINRLLEIEDTREFVECSYEVLLRRKADIVGVRHSLRALISDKVPRVTWLKSLRDSEEGRRVGARLRWLNFWFNMTRLHRWLSMVPLMGGLTNWLWHWLTLGSSINKIEDKLLILQSRMEVVNNRTLDALEYTYARQYGLQVDGNLPQEKHADNPSAKALGLSNEYIWEFFLEHARHFRGSEADISKSCEVYLPIFSDLLENEIEKPIVDIGCGRGEILQMIADAGLYGVGIDANHLAVEYCTRKNLTAYHRDALEYLQAQDSCSCGVVTAIHIVEHLDFTYLMAILKEVLRTLRVGGGIIVESPNPENLVVSSAQFYLDPTHRNPVPLALMQVMLEYSGFIVKKIDVSARGETQVTRSTDDQLNYMLNSPQDYALLGLKPS